MSKYLDIYNIDLSLGSSIFSVKMPKDKYIVDVINNKEIAEVLNSDESSFILKYTNSSYKTLVDTNNEVIENRKKYLLNQPELYESRFIKAIQLGHEKERNNPNDKFILTWEFCKYRLNKRISQLLSFEGRKKIFVNCDE